MAKTEASTTAPDQIAADLLILPLFADSKPGPGMKEISRAMGVDLVVAARDAKMIGKLGQTLVLPTLGTVAAGTVVLTGLGPKAAAGTNAIRSAAMYAVRATKGFASVAGTLTQIGDDPRGAARAYAEGVLLGAHHFDRYKSKPDRERLSVGKITALTSGDRRPVAAGLETGHIHAEAANWVRDLVTTPPADMTPAHIAAVAQTMAKEQGLQCKIWKKHDLEAGGFGGILAVGQGSVNEPRLIELSYQGAGGAKPYAITGKGISFDSGGLDIKSAKWMEHMKDDMAGAAAAIAVMRAAAQLKLKVNLIAAIGSAENMPGGSAQRPGDIITHRGGKTSEVGDTDAEGRILLADVLAYLDEKKPRVIIDSATLTSTGLGEDVWAIFGTDQSLVDELRAAGDAAGEPGWQFPLIDAYSRHTRSEVADIKNADWVGADTLASGIFLRYFVGDTAWAHLDVGDTAYLEAERGEWPEGATGCPTRVILRYLEDQAGRPTGAG
jgi:leucyl aminopeptidase